MRVGFLQVFNENNWVGYAIDQAMKLCDRLIVVEGSQFTMSRVIPERSNDGTLDILAKKQQEYSNSIEIYKTIRKYGNYRKNQAENFNFALSKCKIGDYFLPLDADEFYFDETIHTINDLIERGVVDFYYASGINLAFSFKWQIIINGDPITYTNVFFKKNKKLRFVPTHKPVNYGSNKVVDESGKSFLHYVWVKPSERMAIRFKTSKFYSDMYKWFQNNWNNIELVDGKEYEFYAGHFKLKRYTGEHPEILTNHQWYNIEDIRNLMKKISHVEQNDYLNQIKDDYNFLKYLQNPYYFRNQLYTIKNFIKKPDLIKTTLKKIKTHLKSYRCA